MTLSCAYTGHDWRHSHYQQIDGASHYNVELCHKCWIYRYLPEAHSKVADGYEQIAGNDTQHNRKYYCSLCLSPLGKQSENHRTTAGEITVSGNTATVTCIDCGYQITVGNLPSFFDVINGEGSVYRKFLTTQIFASDQPGSPIHTSHDSTFPYFSGTIYIPKGGRLSLSLNEGALNGFFSQLGYIECWNQRFHLKTVDTIRIGNNPIYQRYESGSVSINPIDVITDFSDYQSTKTVIFTEENRNGVVKSYSLSYRFCDVYPVLAVSTPDDRIADATLDAAVPATAANTFWSKNEQQFNLRFTKGTFNDKPDIMNPLGKAKYTLSQWQDSAWVAVSNIDVDSEGSFPAQVPFDALPVISSETIINVTKNRAPYFVSKYRLHVSARNVVGNKSDKDFYFFLDTDVLAVPKVVWSYDVPTRAIDEGCAEGKTAGELDYDLLAQPDRRLVTIKVFDENFITEEGYFGLQPQMGENNQLVSIIKDPTISGDQETADANLIRAEFDGFGTDAAYGNRKYKQFKLTIRDFLNQLAPDERTINTAPMTINRIMSGETLVQRTVNVPLNTWNIPFYLKLCYRDWVGNEKVVLADAASECPYFKLALNNKSIYTPAFCPDIQFTTVYVAGEGDNLVANTPTLAINPPYDMLLEATVLPTFRAMIAKFQMKVVDLATNQPVYPDPAPESGYSEESIALEDASGSAIVLRKVLRYGHSYGFFVRAVNENGYATEPESRFDFTMNKATLVINRSGALFSDEEWNWRYRLMGDVIVPSGIRLLIIPGGEVIAPKMPAIFADRRTKLIVKSGATLIVDGAWNDGAGTFDPGNNYLNVEAFVNLLPSGLDAKLDEGGNPETIYQFDGVNNWGGVYFESGYNGVSYIRRARICGAYDGVVLFGTAGIPSPRFTISDSLILSNYIGVHVTNNGKLTLDNSILDSNLEYGVKTDGSSYSLLLDNVGKTGAPNRLSDYYSGRQKRRLRFEELKNNAELKNVEQGGIQ